MAPTLNPDMSFPLSYIRYRASSACHWVLHSHAGVELYHPESGEGLYRVAGVRCPLAPATVTLLHGPSRHHIFIRGNPAYVCTVLEFRPAFVVNVPMYGGRNTLQSVLPDPNYPIVQFTLSAADHRQFDSLLQCIYSEWAEPTPASGAAICAYLRQLLLLLARAQTSKPRNEAASAYERLLIEQVTALVDEWIDTDFSLEDLARYCNISTGHLRRVFSRGAGVALGQYIADRRFGLAYNALRYGSTITEACAVSGYQDLSSFTRAFKKKTGITPSEFVLRLWLRRAD